MPLDPTVPAGQRVVRGACPHDCPDTCALLTTVENGRAIAIRGAPDHPATNGVLCTKVARYLDRTYSDQRVLHPMRRVGRKGEGRFERISWGEAIATIARRFGAIAASPDGPEAILPYSYAGTMGLLQYASMDRRFFHRLGASLLDRTICATAGKAGWAAVVGASVGMDFEQYAASRLILIWGSNPIASNLHFWTRAQEAKRRGAKLIAIDPYRSATAEKCSQHIALLPGTDGALALGLMHVLIAEDMLDHDYVDRHTLGFAELAERAAAWTPERTAQTCGISTAEVLGLARDYGTVKPAAIRVNYGMQRVAGGGNAVRAIACLPALVGAWRDPAGGALLSSSGTYPTDTAALERPDLIRGRPRTINMTTIGDALHSAAPPIRALYVYNSNPVAIAPESGKVRAGFAREDLFCVVHEIFQTDTADFADVLLPATTQLEQFDVHSSYGHLYALANNPAIAPVGEALPNTEVFRRLAAAMGFTEPCFRDSDEDLCRMAWKQDDPRAQGLAWEALKHDGWRRLNVPVDYAPFAHGNFPTPSGKCEFRSAALAAQGQDPLPDYVPPRESVATNPALARRFPLAFISPPARNFLNSSFANLPAFTAEERTPWLDLNAVDAQPRGIGDGDRVRIFNDRGSFTATARVGDRARPGVAVAPSVWWQKLAPDGCNANAVTAQALTDLGRAATFYDCLVEVARA
jgi:anaerobic selenocysteine-containing dehydrogenase